MALGLHALKRSAKNWNCPLGFQTSGCLGEVSKIWLPEILWLEKMIQKRTCGKAQLGCHLCERSETRAQSHSKVLSACLFRNSLFLWHESEVKDNILEGKVRYGPESFKKISNMAKRQECRPSCKFSTSHSTPIIERSEAKGRCSGSILLKAPTVYISEETTPSRMRWFNLTMI